MSPQKWGIGQIVHTATLKRWKRAMVSRFWRARTTVAHAAWTTMRMIARTTVTASAGFAEPSRAMADIMAVPAVSHGRPWFAGAARYPSNAA